MPKAHRSTNPPSPILRCLSDPLRCMVATVLFAGLGLGLWGSALLAQPAVPGDGAVRLTLDLEYLPKFRHDEDPGDLYLYLDGDVLAWVPRGGQFAPTPAVRFERWVEPGAHVVRVAMESHERKGKGWKHRARIAPVAIVFRLEAEVDAELRVHLEEAQGVFAKEKGPVSYAVSQGGRILQNLEKGATPLPEWPFLCEEVEANVEPGRKKLPARLAKQLKGCVRWASLWDGGAPAADRESARRTLERYDYEPGTYKRIFE